MAPSLMTNTLLIIHTWSRALAMANPFVLIFCANNLHLRLRMHINKGSCLERTDCQQTLAVFYSVPSPPLSLVVEKHTKGLSDETNESSVTHKTNG